MTNIEKQKWLDRKKWVRSEKAGNDWSGLMEYCYYCPNQQYGNVKIDTLNLTVPTGCLLPQKDRENNCACAKAYRRQYK